MSATPRAESATIHIDYCWSFCVARARRLTDCECPCHETENDATIEVIRVTFKAPLPEDEWCYLAASCQDREAALTWANEKARENRRRYLVKAGRFGGPKRWLIYPENTDRSLPPAGPHHHAAGVACFPACPGWSAPAPGGRGYTPGGSDA